MEVAVLFIPKAKLTPAQEKALTAKIKATVIDQVRTQPALTKSDVVVEFLQSPHQPIAKPYRPPKGPR